MSPRTGRPPRGDVTRTENLTIRITVKERQELDEIADFLKISRTDCLMKGVSMLRTFHGLDEEK